MLIRSTIIATLYPIWVIISNCNLKSDDIQSPGNINDFYNNFITEINDWKSLHLNDSINSRLCYKDSFSFKYEFLYQDYKSENLAFTVNYHSKFLNSNVPIEVDISSNTDIPDSLEFNKLTISVIYTFEQSGLEGIHKYPCLREEFVKVSMSKREPMYLYTYIFKTNMISVEISEKEYLERCDLLSN